MDGISIAIVTVLCIIALLQLVAIVTRKTSYLDGSLEPEYLENDVVTALSRELARLHSDLKDPDLREMILPRIDHINNALVAVVRKDFQ